MPIRKQSPVVDALQAATKGLVWVSDSDAPLEAFSWPAGALDDAALRKHAGAPSGAAVETMALGDFFHAVPNEDKSKFDRLEQTLKQLPGVKVYKIGDEAEKTVFIVGKAFDDSWAGVKTTVVET